MPSPTCKVLEIISSYIPREKAVGILDRQLPKCNATADNLTSKEVAGMLDLVLALSLYIPDKSNRIDLKTKLQALA